MSRTVKLEEHLTAEQLRARYREAKDPAERSHAQIVWLIARGESAKRAAEISGYSPRWVSEVVRRYNEGGPEALPRRPLAWEPRGEVLARRGPALGAGGGPGGAGP